MLYFAHSDLSLSEVLSLFASVPYTLVSKQAYDEIISSIDGKSKTPQTLFSGYYDNFVKGINGVFSSPSDLSARLTSSVARFSAYKAQKVTSLLNEARNRYAKDSEYNTVAKAILNTYNRYQATEYNTCVARSRTAKQWESFNQPENLKALPNIRWIPSRSANPREAHIPFYNRVWAKNDPFWNDNQPGSLWNCKCDWQETFEPVTDNPQFKSTAQQGLKLNPAKSGEIFSSDATYFKVRNKKQVEYDCQANQRNYIQKNYQKYTDKTAMATINNEVQSVKVLQWGVRETAQSMFGSKYFWLKNEILKYFDFFLKKAKYIGSKSVDLNHNTGRTLRRKKQFEKYHYFNVKIWDTNFCMQVVQDKQGNYFLYTITKNIPKI